MNIPEPKMGKISPEVGRQGAEAMTEGIRPFLLDLEKIRKILVEEESVIPEGESKAKYGAVIDVRALTSATAALEESFSGQVLDSQHILSALFNLRETIKNSGGVPFGLFQIGKAGGETHAAILKDNLVRLVAQLADFSRTIDSLKIIFTKNRNIVNELGVLQDVLAQKMETFTSKTIPNLESRTEAE